MHNLVHPSVIFNKRKKKKISMISYKIVYKSLTNQPLIKIYNFKFCSIFLFTFYVSGVRQSFILHGLK